LNDLPIGFMLPPMCVFTPIYKGIHLHFPKRLAALRQARRISPEQLAEKTAIDLLQLQRLESGYSKPTFEDVRRIADALQVAARALLGLSG
jgi:transcriptional regulator with XRE-family HTH domain